jgi:dihydroxy-acid dehydratase
LLKERVRVMVRIPDARMSGTSYGTCVLHVAPESFVGGPLALVQDGALITLDESQRRLHLEVAEDELLRRKKSWPTPPRMFDRGYGALYSEHIGQADQGCDFDFLARVGATVEPEAG